MLQERRDLEAAEQQRGGKKEGYVRNRFDGTFSSRYYIDTRCKFIIFLCAAGLVYVLYNTTMNKHPLGVFYSMLTSKAQSEGNDVVNVDISSSDVQASSGSAGSER